MKKHDLHDSYEKAFYRILKASNDDHIQDEDLMASIRKLIYYGVNAVNSREKSNIIIQGEAEYNFQFAESIKAFMGSLTPKEFMTIFPIDKVYDGRKCGFKDYFSTMEYINTLEQDKPIGGEIENFLWEYMNSTIHIFLVNLFGCVDDLRRLQGQPGMMEEFCEMNGIETYTKHFYGSGKEYLLNNRTGKTVKLEKPRPKHIKVLR